MAVGYITWLSSASSGCGLTKYIHCHKNAITCMIPENRAVKASKQVPIDFKLVQFIKAEFFLRAKLH